jgi:hypothetical protein
MVGDVRQASQRGEMLRDLAQMVSAWETSGELPTEFAERLVDYLEGRLSVTALANGST